MSASLDEEGEEEEKAREGDAVVKDTVGDDAFEDVLDLVQRLAEKKRTEAEGLKLVKLKVV